MSELYDLRQYKMSNSFTRMLFPLVFFLINVTLYMYDRGCSNHDTFICGVVMCDA